MSEKNDRLKGVFSPVVTPFSPDLAPDPDRLLAHCRWLLARNVGLTVFGTNSEANSMSVDEKMMLLDHLIEAGIDTSAMMPGTGLCALTDTVTLTRHAVELGCAGTLMLPPFYYKDVGDDGLFASVSEVIQRVGEASLQVYLYHIPPIAQVGYSADLVDRLVSAYPRNIAGIKDSSGDWGNTQSYLERQWDDFSVFVGSESLLLQNMRHGGAGCISATANINPIAIDGLFRNWRSLDADAQQASLNEVRNIIASFPVIPALKAAIAQFSSDPSWLTMRPPLTPLDAIQRKELALGLKRQGFSIEVPTRRA